MIQRCKATWVKAIELLVQLASLQVENLAGQELSESAMPYSCLIVRQSLSTCLDLVRDPG